MRGDFQSRRDLIPGLPEELALECLVRVPFQFYSYMKSVSRSWRHLITDRSFYRQRRRVEKHESLFCLIQPLTSPSSIDGEVKGESHQHGTTPLYAMSVYNTTLDTWHRVALPERVPLFCECVALQDAGKVLLIGGWDPETLQPVSDVFVLDFSGGGRWKRGKPMTTARSFFACASVGSTKVYVAGGHDDEKNALRSAEVYDVEKDEWVKIPPMREGRDECHGFSMVSGLGFCVLSGYVTETQGQFRSDAEVYDSVSNSWSLVKSVWPFLDLSPRGRTVVAGDLRGCRIRCFLDSERQCQPRWEREDDSMKWKLVVETVRLPETKMSSVFVGSLSGQAVAMIGDGGEESGKTMMMMRVEKNGGKLNHVNVPYGFSSLPFSYSSIYV